MRNLRSTTLQAHSLAQRSLLQSAADQATMVSVLQLLPFRFHQFRREAAPTSSQAPCCNVTILQAFLQLASLLYKKHRCVETSRFFKHRYNCGVALASALPSGTHQVSVLQTPSQPALVSSPIILLSGFASLTLGWPPLSMMFRKTDDGRDGDREHVYFPNQHLFQGSRK